MQIDPSIASEAAGLLASVIADLARAGVPVTRLAIASRLTDRCNDPAIIEAALHEAARQEAANGGAPAQ